MQKIRSSNHPVVIAICDANKSRAQQHPSLKLGSKLKYLNIDQMLLSLGSEFDDDIISANFDVIVIFPIYGQFGTIPKPDSGRILCKTYSFIDNNLLSYNKSK